MILSLLVGSMIGLVMGLTGAGGSIFALPFLILLLNVAPHDAVSIALCAVAVSAIFGVLTRIRSREIEWLPAILFAAIGALFTPLGSLLNQRIPDTIILVGFSIIVLSVAARLWRHAQAKPEETLIARAQSTQASRSFNLDSSTIRPLSSKPDVRFYLGIFIGASISGLLSGLFGVGGGFIIVPTLMFLLGIPIHKAVATSLFIISVLSSSALMSYSIQGHLIMSPLLLHISLGGLGGMLLGSFFGQTLSGPILQKIFSISMVVLSTLVMAKHFHVF